MKLNQVTIRFTQKELLPWLREQARKDNRSLNNFLETVLLKLKEERESDQG